MKSIVNNIKKEYLFQLIRNTSLSQATWVLFLAYRGMSLMEIGLLESIFHITGMVMEIPTGFIADRYGRKTSRVISRILALISCIVTVSSHNFLGFAMGFVLNALAYNLESGAGDALVYDSLAQCKKEEEYMKVRGRTEVVFQFANMLSLIVGGLVATFSYELTYGITAIIQIVSLGISLSFEEPEISRCEKNSTVFHHMGESWRAVKESLAVLPYVLHLEVFSLFYTTTYFYFQTFLKEENYVEYQIGIILAAASILGIILSSFTHKIEKNLGEKKVVILTGILPSLLFLMIVFTKAEPMFMVLLSGLESFMFIVFGDYINKRIPSEHRATLLSFEAMIFSVMMIVFFPIIGAISETYGFKTAFGVIGCLSLIMGSITAVLLGKSKKKEVQANEI